MRSLALGHVELQGTINADQPLQAPLTGNDCMCYDHKIEEEHHDDGSDWEGWFGANKTFRFIETRIDHGDDVYLLGTARDNPYVKDGATRKKGHKDITIQDDENNEFIIAQGSNANSRNAPSQIVSNNKVTRSKTKCHPVLRTFWPTKGA